MHGQRHESESAQSDLALMRARIASSLAWAACVFGLVAYVPSVLASVHAGHLLVAAADTALYGWVLAVRFLPLTSAQRSLHLVLLAHTVGAMLLAALGPFGHGVMWLTGAAVVAAMLLGVRAALWSTAAQVGFVALTSLALFAVRPSWWIAGGAGQPFAWFAFAGGSVFLSAALSVPIGELLGGLASALASVQRERARLADANARIVKEAEKRERLEGELMQARKLEAIGRVAAGISHELNNLLQPIVALSMTARAALPAESAARADVDEIAKAAERLRSLVRQVSTYARRDDGQRAPLSLGDTVRGGLALLRAGVPSAVRIEVDAPGDIDDTILASASELQQVLLNLVANAAYAMRERGGRLGLAVVARAAAVPALLRDAGRGFVRLDVSDEGEGMDAATLERVFEPFFTTKPAGEGTGFGLATVHRIVTSLGGAVSATSTPGVGSTFTLVFPRASA